MEAPQLAQHGQRDGVVAAADQGDHVVVEDRSQAGRNGTAGARKRGRDHVHIAIVDDIEDVKRPHLDKHVVGT